MRQHKGDRVVCHCCRWLFCLQLSAACALAGCGGQTASDSAPENGSSDNAEFRPADGTDQPLTATPKSSHPIDQSIEGAIYRQGLVALDAGDVKAAMAARDQLAGHPQFHLLAEALDAVALVKKRQFDEAIKAAERLSRFPVMQAEAYLIAGEAFHAQGQLQKALDAFDSALQLHPENVRAHRWLGAIYHDIGAMQLATDHLRKVAELVPGDFRSLRLCGLIQYEYQKYDEAVKDYTQALQRSPPKEMADEIRIELADSLRELRQIDEALKQLGQADETAAVLTMRAECLETGAEMDQALAAARQAVELAPTNAQANYVLGRLLLSSRQAEAAVAPLRAAVQADPTNHEPRFLLGRALMQTGNAAEGKAQLERSTELKEIFLKLADLHVKAIEQPFDPEIRVQLGSVAEQLERPQIALNWYRAALGLDPENKTAAGAITRLETAAAAAADD